MSCFALLSDELIWHLLQSMERSEALNLRIALADSAPQSFLTNFTAIGLLQELEEEMQIHRNDEPDDDLEQPDEASEHDVLYHHVEPVLSSDEDSETTSSLSCTSK